MLSGEFKRREAGAPDAYKGPRQPQRKLSRRAAATATARPLSAALRVRESALFRPMRAIGSVVDDLPVAHNAAGSDKDFLIASVHRGFQVFETEHLRLAYLGPRLSEKIRAISAVGQVVLTALKTDVVAWYRLVEVARFRGHTAAPTVLCHTGSVYLLSAAGAEVFVWPLSDVGSEEREADEGKKKEVCILEPLGRLSLHPTFGDCTVACHPPTYLHKVILGSSTGQISLWNLRSQSEVHKFQAHLAGRKEAVAVTALREAPHVLDTVAVGFADGRVCILNAREDKLLMEFMQAQGRITALCFRSGAGAPAHLVTGAPDGSFVVWDLEKRRAHHVHEGAHRGPLSTVFFLPEQPLLVTSAGDNSMKMWIFDTPDGLPRVLRQRCGCPGPGRRMGFYGDGDKELIVGGGGAGTGFVSKISFILDHQNVEYSQNLLKKLPTSVKAGDRRLNFNRLPQLTDMAFNSVRHFDWPAVVTAHEGLHAAFLWSADNKALAPRVLQPENLKDRATVSAVAISFCGNYCVLGLANGTLHRFNLQSGLYRGSMPKVAAEADTTPLGEAEKKKDKKRPDAAPRAHSGRVCGVEITSSGIVLSLAAHPRDCCLRAWKLMTHEAAFSVPLQSAEGGGQLSGLLLRLHRGLAAVALDNGALQVLDLNVRSVVRAFDCGVPATDVAFSGDGRWVAAALRDGGLRIFDLLAARCVDSFVFARPALSLCFSHNTAFLLTSHAQGSAIQVWANKFLFDPSLSAPLLRPEPKEPLRIDEPVEGEEVADEAEPDGEEVAAEKAPLSVTTTPLEQDLLTLSDMPPAKWMAILHLDTVRERNKPTEPAKPLPNAPFFLPTVLDGMTPRFAAPLSDEAAEEAQVSAAIAAAVAGDGSRLLGGESSVAKGLKFPNLLRKSRFDAALEFLRNQTPSGVHLAIEELGPLAGGTHADLEACLSMFEHHLTCSHLADELQVYLSLFLQAHGDELAESPETRERCRKLGAELEQRWSSLNRQCQKVRCFLGMLTHTQSQW